MSRGCPKCGTSFPDEVFFCGYDGTVTVEERTTDNEDPRLGEQLGAYVAVAWIADGAMGRVYEGRHRDTKARVAIKVLHQHVARDRVAVERFVREYETAKTLGHPNIVKVIDFGETADRSYFLTMEYLEGAELSKVLSRQKVLPAARAIRLTCQLALGLHRAHASGVIHRDLKPDNIYLCHDEDGDDVRILDFGSVKLQVSSGPKLTAVGTTLGSPYYMSPEQAMGKLDVDQRTDVFALGAIVYETMTGEVAFEGDNVADILMNILRHDPPPVSASNSSCPPALDSVVDRALSKEKERRYATTVGFAEGVVRAFGLEPSVERWARTPESGIERALSGAAPDSPLVHVASSAQPSPGAVESRGSGPWSDASAIPGALPKRRPPTLVAVGAVLIAIAVACTWLLWS